MSDLGPCRYCHERPAAKSIYTHRRVRQCYPCFRKRYQASLAKADKKYNANPEKREMHRRRQATYRPRRVYLADTTVTFPSIEMKGQAAALIARRRHEFVTRLATGAQTEGPAPSAIPTETEL